MNSNKNIRNFRKKNKKEQKQIVILLGAGSAIPWGGVSSNELKDIFINDKTYQLNDGRNIGFYIFSLLDKFYNKECSNFETFLAVIEEVLIFTLNSTNQGAINEKNTSFISVIFELKEEIELLNRNKTDDEKRTYWFDLFSHFLNIVIRKIDEYNKNIFSNKFIKLNNDLLSFVRFFRNKNYSIKIYNANYDNVIPSILKEEYKVYEGLYESRSFIRRFNYDLDKFRVAKLSHFNIHGSIFLRHEIINNRYEVVYSDKLQEIYQALYLNSGNPSENLLFSPIITGYNKTQRKENQPFNLGFNAFSNDLNNCDALLTIGYSFSDPHINCIIKTFTSWSKVRFLNITKDGLNCDISYKYQQLDYNVTQLIKKEEDNIWFKDISGRKYIFKDGFDHFLNDSSYWTKIIYDD